jgi:hypothetical protein
MKRQLRFSKSYKINCCGRISKQTAAELVYRRVDASLPLLGMLSYDKNDQKAIRKAEVSIAKN